MIKNFKELGNKKNCCGCFACLNVCPLNAIKIFTDDEGFSYPLIDNKICVSCNLCSKSCQYNNNLEVHFNSDISYGFSNNNDVIKKSSSGGLFFEIASNFIKSGGVVFAVTYASSNLNYIKCENIKDLSKTLCSKYLQADVGYIYKSVKEELRKNKLVLFCGTPCYVNGLHLFLGKDFQNLYMIDFIFHGVCSPKVWNTYLSENNLKPTEVNFRDKTYGWENYSLKIKSNDRLLLENHKENTYFKLFLSDLILRPSCYNCTSKGTNRHSDITLDDFWGSGKFDVKVNKDGTSLIIVNTPKGKSLLRNVNASIYKGNQEFLRCNNAYYSSASIPKKRTEFFNGLSSGKPLSYLVKYSNPSFFIRVVNKIKKVIKRVIKYEESN